ncbi:MAG: family 16 glycosylhydrolase [Bacteroidota bacterium]
MMKLRSFLIIFLFGTLGLISYSQEYVQVWGDEFNTPGLPDSTKWGYEEGFIRNGELQYYTVRRQENARIEDTVLIIEARKENYKGAEYTSASLISRGTGDWKYGKIEISAKVPNGKGTWPALWMMPTYSVYGGWPKSGEIDIMEHIGVEPEHLFFYCHFEGTDGTGHQSNGSGPITAIPEPYNKFIKFTLIWTPDRIEWYANGQKYHQYTKPSDDYRRWPFDKMFYLIMNLAYGGSWGGYDGVDDSKLPHQYMIDYVRVYQLKESEGPFNLEVLPAKGGEVSISPEMDMYPDGTEVTLTATPAEGYAFEAWKHHSGANPYTFTLRKNMSITPSFVDTLEYLSNTSFDQSWANWVFYTYENASIYYEADVIDSTFVIDVRQSPGVDWQLGFQELNLSLEKGNYVLTFDAWAEQQESLLITVSKNYGDYAALVEKRVDITRQETSYTVPIEMTASNDNVRLYFGIGNFSGKFYIDNISLKPEIATNMNIPGHMESKPGMVVYPNPVNHEIAVSIPEAYFQEENSLQVLSPDGRIIQKKTNISRNGLWNLSMVKAGWYLVKYASEHHQLMEKIIVQ